MTARLIVSIDTEEEGLWGGVYRATGNTVRNVQGVPRFQQLCDRLRVRPTYLIDAPVVQDTCSVELLREIQDDDRCEIGAHLHPWCNPPLDDRRIDGRTSFLCNLPESIQRSKLEWLTETIEDRFTRRPTSFRAGRYGLDMTGARILHDLGYTVDSSVIPFTDYSAQGGPNFCSAPSAPYFIDGDDLCVPHQGGLLLEVPVSVGFNRPDFERAHALQQSASARWAQPFHLEGILDRLGFVRRIKFSPEQTTASRLKQLVDSYVARSAPAMVLMFHSSSLQPGTSPYVQTEGDLQEFLGRIDETIEYCLERHGMSPATLSEFAASYVTEPSTVSEHSMSPGRSDGAVVEELVGRSAE